MTLSADELAVEFQRFLPTDPSPAVNPGHRVEFRWPPRLVSHDYHLPRGAWSSSEPVTIHNETFTVEIAHAYEMTFGRIAEIQVESAGKSLEAMVANLRTLATPYIVRTRLIAQCLGRPGRFEGNIRELPGLDLLKLLYCWDRDVAREASLAIETHASDGVFTPALIHILRDRSHPHRRIAQWCVLDMFEDLPSFARTPAQSKAAVYAIKDLIWDAEDDYARTIFKAGVVLGGHISTAESADALISCLCAPSKVGRRSAIHAVFHLVEWVPGRRGEVVTKLKNVASDDPEPLLRAFAKNMAADIQKNEFDHRDEPIFPEESQA